MKRNLSEIVQDLLALAFFIFLAFASTRGLVFKDGTVGHNWDWSIPPTNSELIRYGEEAFYVWSERSLGYPKLIGASSNLFYLLVYFVAKAGITGELFSKLFILIILALGGFIFYFCFKHTVRYLVSAKSVLKKDDSQLLYFVSVLSAVLYGFSPFVFNELNGGALTQLFTYVFLPLFIFFSLKLSLSVKIYSNYTFYLVLLNVLLPISIHNLFFANCILVIVLLSCSNNLINSIKKLCLIAVFSLLTNAFWIIPNLYSFTSVKDYFFDNQLFKAATLVDSPQWSDLVAGIGYFRDFYIPSVISGTGSLIYFAGYAFFIFILLGLFFLNNRTSTLSKYYHTVFFIYFVSLVFSVSGNKPFGDLILWLYNNIGFLNLFRTTHHFITVVSLSYSILMGLSLLIFILKLKSTRIKQLVVFCLFVLVIFYIHAFWYRGDLGLSKLQKFRPEGNYIDLFSYPKDWSNLDTYLKPNSTSNVFLLPIDYSPLFLKTAYQFTAQGGDPLVFNLVTPSVSRGFSYDPSVSSLITATEKYLYRFGFDNTSKNILDLLNVSKIVYRNDVLPNFGRFSRINSDNFFQSELTTFVEKEKLDLKKFTSVKIISFEPFPRLFATKDVIYTSFSDYNKHSLSSFINSFKPGISNLEKKPKEPYEKTRIMPYSANDEGVVTFKIESAVRVRPEFKKVARGVAPTEFNYYKVACDGFNVISRIYKVKTSSYVQLNPGCYSFAFKTELGDSIKMPDILLSTDSFDPHNSYFLNTLILPREIEFFELLFDYEISPGFVGEVFIWSSKCNSIQSVSFNTKGGCKSVVLKRHRVDKSSEMSKARFGFTKSDSRLEDLFGLGANLIKLSDQSSGSIKITNIQIIPVLFPVVYLETEDLNSQNCCDGMMDLEFSQISPTKYVIKVNETKGETYTLNFIQSYDSNWRLSRVPSVVEFSKPIINRRYPVIEYAEVSLGSAWLRDSKVAGTHYKANLFGHAWVINPESTSKVTYVIEYLPQKVYEVSVLVSVLFLALLFIFKTKRNG